MVFCYRIPILPLPRMISLSIQSNCIWKELHANRKFSLKANSELFQSRKIKFIEQLTNELPIDIF